MRVRITEEFTGYPDDTDKSRTEYRVGQTLDLDETFARLIIGKGHASGIAEVHVEPLAVDGEEMMSRINS